MGRAGDRLPTRRPSTRWYYAAGGVGVVAVALLFGIAFLDVGILGFTRGFLPVRRVDPIGSVFKTL
jgi:hypothetical protein